MEVARAVLGHLGPTHALEGEGTPPPCARASPGTAWTAAGPLLDAGQMATLGSCVSPKTNHRPIVWALGPLQVTLTGLLNSVSERGTHQYLPSFSAPWHRRLPETPSKPQLTGRWRTTLAEFPTGSKPVCQPSATQSHIWFPPVASPPIRTFHPKVGVWVIPAPVR